MPARRARLQVQQLVTRLRGVGASRPERFVTIPRPLLEAVIALLDGRQERPCGVCGTLFLARADGRTCSDACRARAYRARRKARRAP